MSPINLCLIWKYIQTICRNCRGMIYPMISLKCRNVQLKLLTIVLWRVWVTLYLHTASLRWKIVIEICFQIFPHVIFLWAQFLMWRCPYRICTARWTVEKNTLARIEKDLVFFWIVNVHTICQIQSLLAIFIQKKTNFPKVVKFCLYKDITNFLKAKKIIKLSLFFLRFSSSRILKLKKWFFCKIHLSDWMTSLLNSFLKLWKSFLILAKSFFSPLPLDNIPAASLHCAWSTTALQWLSVVPR